MMVLKNLENVRSINDIMSIYKGLRSVGLTNAEIAEYGMTLFMGMAYPNMLEGSDTTYYEEQITNLTLEIGNAQGSISDINAEVALFISDLDDLTIANLMTEAWSMTASIHAADMDAYYLIADIERNYYFDVHLYYSELVPAYESDVWDYIEEIYWGYGLSNEEIAFYEALYANDTANAMLHQQFINKVNEIDDYFARDYIMQKNSQIIQIYIDIARKYLDIEMYEMLIAEADNNLLMLTAIYNFLGDPINQAVVEDVLVMLLDEVEVMSMDPNVKALDILLKFMQDPDLRYLDMNMMVQEMQSLSALMANMGSTIDLADTAIIAQLLNGFIVEYVDAMEITDPLVKSQMLLGYQAMAVEYLPQILAMQDILSTFLASMDEGKINHIMSVMREYNWIRWYHDDAELKETIVDAKLVMAVLGDDSLDYEAVIELIYGIYYDMNDMNDMAPTMTVVDAIAEMDAMMLQAGLLVDIGLFGITLENEDDVYLFMTMMSSLFGWEILPEVK